MQASFRHQLGTWARTAAWGLALCLATAPAPAQTTSDRLYQALGAEQGIGRIVDELVVLILQDARIKRQFKETNMKNLAKLLKQQFCQLSGGPCLYTGDDMQLVHDKMGVTGLQFNAMVEDLQAALDRNDIPAATQNKLIALLAPMQRIIVQPGIPPQAPTGGQRGGPVK